MKLTKVLEAKQASDSSLASEETNQFEKMKMATADTKENTVDNREHTNDNRTSNARDFIDQVPNDSQAGSADNCYIRIDSEAG